MIQQYFWYGVVAATVERGHHAALAEAYAREYGSSPAVHC